MADNTDEIILWLRKIESGTHNAGYYAANDLKNNGTKILYKVNESHDFLRDLRNNELEHKNDITTKVMPKLEKIQSNQEDIKRLLTDISRSLQNIDRKTKQ